MATTSPFCLASRKANSNCLRTAPGSATSSRKGAFRKAVGTPDERVSTVVVLGDAEFQAKMRAMAAHATQMPKDSPWAQATPEQLRGFMGVEHFELVPAYCDGPYGTPEDDVFAGL